MKKRITLAIGAFCAFFPSGLFLLLVLFESPITFAVIVGMIVFVIGIFILHSTLCDSDE